MGQRDYISKTEEEIRRDFALAFDRLVRAGQAYDAGHHSEALALAALVYLFVHDKGRSTMSLLTMVSRKDIGFRDTGVPVNPRNLITEHPLAVSRMEVEHLQYLPALGETQGFVGDKEARFGAWWEATVAINYPHDCGGIRRPSQPTNDVKASLLQHFTSPSRRRVNRRYQ